MKKRGNTDNVTSSYTDGEGQIYAILLVKLCDVVAPPVSILRAIMRKANCSNYCLFCFSQ